MSHLIIIVVSAIGGALAAAALVRRRRPPEPKKSEALFRAAFEASRDGLFVLDEKNVVVEANAAWLALTGLPREDVLGSPLGVSSSSDARVDPAAFKETAAVPIRGRAADRTIEMSCIQNIAAGGRLLTLGRARDVTEQLDGRSRLLEQLRAAIDASAEGIFIARPRDGAPLYRNRAAEPWLEPGSPSLERIEQLVRAGRAVCVEVERGEHADRRVAVLELQPAPGDAMIGALRDVTDERKAQSRRKAAEARLYEAQRMESLGVLAGGLAHDFNNLLTGVLGFATLARSARDLESTRKLLDSAVKSAERAAALTRQLRAFSDHRACNFEHADLAAIVTEVEPLLRRVLGESVAISIRRCEDATLLCDVAQVRQLLVNLALRLRNSLPHDGRARVALRLDRVALDDEAAAARALPRSGDYLRLEIEDDGPPLEATQRTRLFEPFAAGKQVGLEVPAVYGIVVRHNGAVEVEPGASGGTLFRILLPVEAKPRTETRRLARPATPPEGTPLARRARVLVADDDASVRELVASVLGRLELDVETFQDGQAALDRLRDARDELDLILSDVIMPRLSGVELATAALTLAPRARVLLMTGYSDAVLPPGIPFLEKPFLPAQLERRVREMLGRDVPKPSSVSSQLRAIGAIV